MECLERQAGQAMNLGIICVVVEMQGTRQFHLFILPQQGCLLTIIFFYCKNTLN